MCDVLDSQAVYMKHTVTVRGKAISLVATPAFDLRTSILRGISQREDTVEGRLEMSERHLRGKPAVRHLALSVIGRQFKFLLWGRLAACGGLVTRLGAGATRRAPEAHKFTYGRIT